MLAIAIVFWLGPNILAFRQSVTKWDKLKESSHAK